MSAVSNTTKSPLDILKWLVAVVLFSVAVVGNIYFAEFSLIYRVLAVSALVLLAVGAASISSQGRRFVALVKEANIERRKVVWPTRQETTQTTLIVLVVVFITGLILWGIDSVLGWAVKLLIG
ncbi:MAG: preprotein translocase subunit SecE [Venatoribacter sp.]